RPRPPRSRARRGALGQRPHGHAGTLPHVGHPLLAGRDFDERDAAGRPRGVGVSRPLAPEFWPGKGPIRPRTPLSWGRGIEGGGVGVVGDARLNTLDTDVPRILYWPQAQLASGFMVLMARTGGPPRALAPAVRAELAAMDRDLPPGRFAALDEVAS